MTIASAVLPLLRRHASSSELNATTADLGPSSNLTQHQQLLINSTTSENHRPSNPLTLRPHRKPSPGLAARLKALGFGTESKKHQATNDPAATADYIGRIPEDHIRSIDSLHRANSTNSTVPRRGRTWSSASGRPAPQITGCAETGFTVLSPSIDNNTKETTPATTATSTISISEADIRADEVGRRELSPATTTTSAISISEADIRADEIGRREPSPAPKVEVTDMSAHDVHGMDAQKYRLPEHVNGNGTKAMPETKVAHMGRMDEPPPPMPKDSPDGPGDFSTDVQSYFNPFGLQRSGSIYTLSRVSFASQLAQLTSLQLPDAESLAGKVSEIPTSQAAARALMNAADQIRSWISKASEVLGGLDADDDVEWAAAGGREGLEDVDHAILRFEELITVYVTAIEELQSRSDISAVTSSELKMVVTQVETILNEWEKIRRSLFEVKGQVGVAIEWEELWNVVLGDIGYEMDILSRLVFEMEEKRHKSLLAEASEEGVDLKDLETIVEETPPAKNNFSKNRFSVTAAFPMSPNPPSTPTAQDDSSLLALFARMQPLRASLDFLPMRLSTFHSRAEETFPTACEELEARREGLENSWKSLEKDAETLRRELGEDRWVLVFRGAGRQANKMHESVGRSLAKVTEAIETGQHLNNPSAMGQKIENYESKKTHYGPAIERVLAIIEKGVQDRLTVNGEIVRLHSEMQSKWDSLKEQMYDLDKSIEALDADRQNQPLRDSVSSLMSNDTSTMGSTNETPGSSPASSVIMSNLQHGSDPTTPGKSGKGMSGLPQMGARRTPLSGSQLPRIGLIARSSGYGQQTGRSSPSPASRGQSATPTGNRIPRPSFSSNMGGAKPRWNSSVKTEDGLIGHTFKPLSWTPSPNAKVPPEHSRSSSISKIPLRRSLGSDLPSSPVADSKATTPLPSRPKNLSFRDRMASPSPGPYSQQALSPPPTRSRLQSQSSRSNLKATRRQSVQPTSSSTHMSKRASMQPTDFNLEQASSSYRTPLSSRPMSSLAVNNRRSSLLPQPRGRPDTSVTGRESPHAVASAASAMQRNSSQVSTDSRGRGKPKWH